MTSGPVPLTTEVSTDSETLLSALIDVVAVALMLSVSQRHVRRLADQGAMPRPMKLGALVRWRRDDIVKWISDGCPHCD